MFPFRRCRVPSVKLAAGLLLLWLLVAAAAWAGLAVGFEADQMIEHAGLLAYFAVFSAAIPACIHYAILRRRSTLRMERLALGLAALVAVTALSGKTSQLHREGRIINSLYYDSANTLLEQCESLQKERRYSEMVFLLENEHVSYRNQVAALGGLKELIRMAGGPRRVLADGTSDLFCYLQMCIGYNAVYTPINVEYILMRAMPYQARKTREFQEFAAALSQSSEPMLKAYGLWMLERHGEYRDFVYAHAGQGEAWAYGFAADATIHDPDPLRALDVLDRYHTNLQNGIFRVRFARGDMFVHEIDRRIAEIVNSMDSGTWNLNQRHKILVSQMLDRNLQTDSARENPKITRLFAMMNRAQDEHAYLTRIRQNHDQYFRSYMVEMLLEKKLLSGLNPDTIREIHHVLDEHLKTGITPGITDEEMRRIFEVMGRGGQIKAAKHPVQKRQ